MPHHSGSAIVTDAEMIRQVLKIYRPDVFHRGNVNKSNTTAFVLDENIVNDIVVVVLRRTCHTKRH